MNKKIRVGWLSDWCEGPTGFGKVAKNVLSLLKETGRYELFHLAIGGSKASKTSLCFSEPVIGNFLGKDSCGGFIRKYKLDVLIGTLDTPWADFLIDPENSNLSEEDIKTIKTLPIIIYQPLDGVSINGSLPSSFKNLYQLQKYPVVFNQWTRKIILEEIPEIKPIVIPHGVDREFYIPLDKEEARSLFLPKEIRSSFITGMIAANRLRKGYPEALSAFSKFIHGRTRTYPYAVSDAYFYPHCQWDAEEGFDVQDLVRDFGISSRVVKPTNINRGNSIPEKAMVWIYNMLDLHLLITRGEGFGLPHVEATSCGIPSFATDCTGLSEITPDPGFLIPVKCGVVDSYRNIERQITDVDALAERIAQFYLLWKSKEGLEQISQDCRKFTENYTWKKTLPLWENIIYKAVNGKEETIRS
jgi:glycosyltransferase involved in cell wall biosynthesis